MACRIGVLRVAALVSCAASLWSCTIASRDSGRPLVPTDAPVFDQSLRDLDPNELDLSSFWTEGGPDGDEPIAIHSDTYANLVEEVSDGIVNLYTRVLEEREARIGVKPSDLLPIRIPIVSAVLDFIPFQVPIPFRSQGFSLGSGFLINEMGFILTNAHVVKNATDIQVVRTHNRQEYPARIIGIDPMTDTALIRIAPQPDMKVLSMGSSEAMSVGELVIAVGNPLGLNHTVTSGMISAKERIVPEQKGSLLDYLQTDSAINPGSSGGPLLNLRGEVVGINTAIASDAQNIGFAVPIDTVKRVMPLLIAGSSQRGWFGASARPVSVEEAQDLAHENLDAVIVDMVVAGSPAARAGVRSQDVIVRVDGEAVVDFISFRRQLLGLRPGQSLQLSLERAGESIEVTSVLGIRPE